MAAHGQTIYAAAGDSGAYDDSNPMALSPVVDDPASQPYVVGVGGTTLTVIQQAVSYVSEAVWNDGSGKVPAAAVSALSGQSLHGKQMCLLSIQRPNRNVPDVP